MLHYRILYCYPSRNINSTLLNNVPSPATVSDKCRSAGRGLGVLRDAQRVRSGFAQHALLINRLNLVHCCPCYPINVPGNSTYPCRVLNTGPSREDSFSFWGESSFVVVGLVGCGKIVCVSGLGMYLYLVVGSD